VFYLMRRRGLSPEAAEKMLNEGSGLRGVSGLSNDMRDLETAAADGHAQAELAIEVFCYRARKYIGAYMAALNGADAVVFTAGIGENAPGVRARICAGLDRLGIAVDPQRNREGSGERRLSPAGTGVGVWVVPTREELLIARDTYACITGGSETR
jgi:acetate kinase